MVKSPTSKLSAPSAAGPSPVAVAVSVTDPLTKTRKAELLRRAKEAFGPEAVVVVQRAPRPAPDAALDEAFAALDRVAAKVRAEVKRTGTDTSPTGIAALIKQVRAERCANPTAAPEAPAAGSR